jgi:hypothetical protein
MSVQGDPHRTLGVPPGASLNEIRSAYRRLAKQYHPDAAGERALPRFLAIQAAYEQLVDGDGRLRAAGGGGQGRAPADAGGTPAWRADPARARASREAWRARRAGTRSGTADRRPGAAPDDAAGRRRRTAEPGHRRQRKATQGSTTYDEASEVPRDPEWDGGSWYGASLGTYWTINPREYADPRKHGPEYQARARRATGLRDTGTTGTQEDRDANAGEPGTSWTWHDATGGVGAGPRRTATDGGGFEWSARDWTYAPGDRGRDDGGGGRTADAGPAPGHPVSLTDRIGPGVLLALARRRTPGPRILLALVAWPPIGWVLDTALASPPACPAGEAACQVPLLLPLLQVVAQPLLLLGLYLVPVAAAVGAWAAIVALVLALPGMVVALAFTAPGSAVRPAILAAVVGAYIVALATGATVAWRQRVGEESARR